MSQRVIQVGNEIQSQSESYAIRQQHRRINACVAIRVSSIDPEIDPESGAPFFRVSEEHSSNISSGGAFVTSAEAVTPGRRVLLEIDVPNGSTLQSIAQVIWKREGIVGAVAALAVCPGYGLQFLASHPDQLRELEEFLASAVSRKPGSSWLPSHGHLPRA